MAWPLYLLKITSSMGLIFYRAYFWIDKYTCSINIQEFRCAIFHRHAHQHQTNSRWKTLCIMKSTNASKWGTTFTPLGCKETNMNNCGTSMLFDLSMCCSAKRLKALAWFPNECKWPSELWWHRSKLLSQSYHHLQTIRTLGSKHIHSLYMVESAKSQWERPMYVYKYTNLYLPFAPFAFSETSVHCWWQMYLTALTVNAQMAPTSLFPPHQQEQETTTPGLVLHLNPGLWFVSLQTNHDVEPRSVLGLPTVICLDWSKPQPWFGCNVKPEIMVCHFCLSWGREWWRNDLSAHSNL